MANKRKKAPKQSECQLPQFFEKHICVNCNKEYKGHKVNIYFNQNNKEKRMLKTHVCPRCISEMEDVRSVLFWI